MSAARAETWAWLLQRASAAVLALCVLVHLIGIIIAEQGGLTAAEIIGRVGGSAGWAAFYGVFVVAAAVHAPIGLRAVLAEMTPLRAPWIDACAVLFAVLLLIGGMGAVIGFFRLGGLA